MGCHFPPAGDHFDPGIEPMSLLSAVLQVDSQPTDPLWRNVYMLLKYGFLWPISILSFLKKLSDSYNFSKMLNGICYCSVAK